MSLEMDSVAKGFLYFQYPHPLNPFPSYPISHHSPTVAPSSLPSSLATMSERLDQDMRSVKGWFSRSFVPLPPSPIAYGPWPRHEEGEVRRRQKEWPQRTAALCLILRVTTNRRKEAASAFLRHFPSFIILDYMLISEGRVIQDNERP